MPQEIISKKRSSEDDASERTVATKKRAVGDLIPVSQTRSPIVEWSTKFGPTCLFGTVNVGGTSQSDGRLALFDLDQTLINTKTGNRFPQDHEDWRWLSSKVPVKLKQLHAEGYTIFIISNQMPPRKITKPEIYFAEWRNKVDLVGHALQDISFRILAATTQDVYRKPLPGMWQAIIDVLKAEGVTLNQEGSFFVGDAAGRKRDHSASDRKFALNVGIQFHTPEEYFLGEAPLPFQLSGFHPSSIRDRPHYLPTQFPLVPSTKGGPGLVLFVGYPAMGKTRTYNKYFKSAGYVYINEEALKTKSNCMKAIEDAVKVGRSVVVDNTNYDASTREDYLRLGENLKVPVRCIVFDGDMDLAWHNDVYRTYILTDPVHAAERPQNSYNYNTMKRFRNAYQRPTAEEGFKYRIITIFWKFEGNEEERKKYMMWLDF